MLGVFWDRDSADALAPDRSSKGSRRIQRPNEVMFPLSLIIRPEFRDSIRSMFGAKHGIDAPEWAKVTETDSVDLWNMDPDAFKNFVGANVATKDFGQRVD
jgi:hypothetical protein